jgi:endonuclease III
MKIDSKIIQIVIQILDSSYELHELARVTASDPFRTLIGGIMSARAKDTQTAPICKSLFSRATSARKLLEIPEKELIEIIRPIGFFNQKARAIRETAKLLLEKYDGRVPDTLNELIEFPGVGRKVANLVLSVAFGKDAICVDTHVHRITNRFGWISTKTPEETETALMEIIPKKLWRFTNHVFVRHGQECCHPTSPWCSRCPVYSYCKRDGVVRSR